MLSTPAPQSNPPIQTAVLAPSAVRVALVCAFAVLWTIWMQPHTIAIRHLVLTLGSLLGLYVIGQNPRLLWTKSARPIAVVALLLAWITFHLFFLSHNYALQLEEYLTIWKRIAWGIPFALGLGIALGADESVQNPDQLAANNQGLASGKCWWIFYLGILMPTLIYLLRASLMMLATKAGWQLPDALANLYPPSTWYIPKTSYVFFCLPALAIACSQLRCIMALQTKARMKLALLYGLSVAAVLAVFYMENIKNGMVYALLIVMFFAVKVIWAKKGRWNARSLLVACALAACMIVLVMHHIQKNDSWKTLFADIKVARQLDQIDSWKYYGAKGYPLNEFGKPVSETNYERAAWAQVVLGFIQEMPQGYGLVLESFGHRAKEKWPDSRLLQSHSGWLDLTFGIGIPGVFLMLLAALMALKTARNAQSPNWSRIGTAMLLSMGLLMTTTEVSQRTYLDALLFTILWLAGLGLQPSKRG